MDAKWAWVNIGKKSMKRLPSGGVKHSNHNFPYL
jgi:hypothetical protein